MKDYYFKARQQNMDFLSMQIKQHVNMLFGETIPNMASCHDPVKNTENEKEALGIIKSIVESIKLYNILCPDNKKLNIHVTCSSLALENNHSPDEETPSSDRKALASNDKEVSASDSKEPPVPDDKETSPSGDKDTPAAPDSEGNPVSDAEEAPVSDNEETPASDNEKTPASSDGEGAASGDSAPEHLSAPENDIPSAEQKTPPLNAEPHPETNVPHADVPDDGTPDEQNEERDSQHEASPAETNDDDESSSSEMSAYNSAYANQSSVQTTPPPAQSVQPPVQSAMPSPTKEQEETDDTEYLYFGMNPLISSSKTSNCRVYPKSTEKGIAYQTDDGITVDNRFVISLNKIRSLVKNDALAFQDIFTKDSILQHLNEELFAEIIQNTDGQRERYFSTQKDEKRFNELPDIQRYDGNQAWANFIEKMKKYADDKKNDDPLQSGVEGDV